MRLLLALSLLIGVVVQAHAQPPGQRFVSIAFHDIDDKAADLEADSVTSRNLVHFLTG